MTEEDGWEMQHNQPKEKKKKLSLLYQLLNKYVPEVWGWGTAQQCPHFV